MKLTEDQRQALQRFATMYGRRWKSVLRSQWMTGRDLGPSNTFNTLQHLRNTIGPSGVDDLRPADLRVDDLSLSV